MVLVTVWVWVRVSIRARVNLFLLPSWVYYRSPKTFQNATSGQGGGLHVIMGLSGRRFFNRNSYMHHCV